MLPSTRLYLTKVTYSNEKKQITVEFSNTINKASKKYPFFPKAHFSLNGMSNQNFLEILSQHDLRKTKVDFKKESVTVFAACFSDLKKVNNLFKEYVGVFSNLIEPERQFLIEKEWNYFDCFDFSTGQIEKISCENFPEVTFDFISDSLKQTVNDLLNSNKFLANDFVRKIVLSKILKIPLMGRESNDLSENIFLENIFFAGSIPVDIKKSNSIQKQKHFFSKSEVDFSKVVSVVSSMPCNNIGFESINCDCCKPSSMNSKNVLLSSEIKVRFLREGFYFNSVSKTWANEFHVSHAFVEQRKRRKREYFYSFFPTGPFSRGSEKKILLFDALNLREKGLVEFVGEPFLKWYCTSSESMLSKEINSLRKKFIFLNSVIEEQQKSVIASDGLFFSQILDKNADFLYWKLFRKSISLFLGKFSSLLIDSNSRFFNKNLAIIFEVLCAEVLNDFKQNTKNSVSCSFITDSKLLVDSSCLMVYSKMLENTHGLNKGLLKITSS